MKQILAAAVLALSSTVMFATMASAQGESAFEEGLKAYQRDDPAEAAKWYRIAADQGLAEAQFQLGLMLRHGWGIPENDAEAVKWFRLAAEQGVTDALALLGTMYLLGEGVPEDHVQAYKWSNLAAARGDRNAFITKNILTQKMTPAQIAEAQKLSSEWSPVSER